MFLKVSFLNKQAKPLRNTREGILFLSKRHTKPKKHIPAIIPNVYTPAIMSEIN